MTHLRVLISETHDPWLNLAMEDYIFNEMEPRGHILFFWRNADTVVIGRHQNPWSECDLGKMEEDGVKLARRQSGGGAVFQDLGNSIFTFMSGREIYSKERNNEILCRAIGHFDIHAEPSGRNDIVVDGRKISGSAFKLTADRAFHHGTLLINTDLSRLGQYLTPDKEKFTSKGVASVKSRVANLSEFNPDIDHESLSRAIIEEFFAAYGGRVEPEILDHEELGRDPKLTDYYERLKDWNWRFGNTPEFAHSMTRRFEWGRMEVHLDTKGGKVTSARIYSDSLMPELVEELMRRLSGRHYTPDDMKAAAEETAEALPDAAEQAREFGAWLAAEVG
jgi:lipoate-protein ligase A